jgi:hypothetical protein
VTVDRTDRVSETNNSQAVQSQAMQGQAVQGEVVDPADVRALRNRVGADRAELSRTVAELAERFDLRRRLRQRATAVRDRARLRVSGAGSRVGRPVLVGFERALRRIALGFQRVGARLRRVDSRRQLPSREVPL